MRPVESTQTERGTEVQPLRRYAVVLHDCDCHSMECVVRALTRIVGLSHDDAVARMLQAHHRGRAVVATVHGELAEHYATALEAGTRLDDLRRRGRGLRVTVHPL